MDMEFKALITGGNHDVKDAFFQQMHQIETLTTSNRYGDVARHIKYFSPDIFVYCIYKETKEGYSKIIPIKHLLTKHKLPFVVVGSEEDCAEFERIAANITDFTINNLSENDAIQQELATFLNEWREKEGLNKPEEQASTPAGSQAVIPPGNQAVTPPGNQAVAQPEQVGQMPVTQPEQAGQMPVPQPGQMPVMQPGQAGQVPYMQPMQAGQMPYMQPMPQPMPSVPVPQPAKTAASQPVKASSAQPAKASKTDQEKTDKEAAKPAPAAKKAAAPRRKRRRRTVGRGRILVIDDNPLMLKVIKEHLHEDYDLATATSGQVALRFLQRRQVDLILLDYEMPDEDGPAVLKKLRANEQTADVPVVFLTGISDRKKIQKALMLQPDGYLLKPIDHEKLINTIKQYID